MKKNTLPETFQLKYPQIKQLFRIMKITAILLLVSVFSVLAEETHSQNQKVSINKNDVYLNEIIDEIEKQTDFLFIYNNRVETNLKTSISTKNEQITTVLDKILKDTEIGYRIEGRHIILSKQSTPTVLMDNQQGNNIKGLIVDEKGEPIIGANVMEKGTTNGTISDINGQFSLTVNEKATLIITYIGYKTQEVLVGNESSIDIRLAEDTEALEEVVVIGFGTAKKVNLTGSISALNTKDIEKLKVTQTSQLLAGMASGINVTQSSSRPGGDQSYVRFRGLGTFSAAGNEPLVLIDGLSSSLDNINANDIESLSILKDAASASIYGARAANGVILIETKKGKDGKAKINYQGDFGFTRASTTPKIVDSWVYAEMYNEALINGGGNPQYSAEEIAKFKSGEDPDNYQTTT